MFVNAEWLKDKVPDDKNQGHIYDIINILKVGIDETKAQMADYQAFKRSFERVKNGGEKQYINEVNDLINDILSQVQTKQDAYVVLGQCMSMGLLDNTIRIIPHYSESKICYMITLNEEEEKENDHKDNDGLVFRSYKPKNYSGKKIIVFSAQLRSANDVLSGIEQGLGLKEGYLHYIEGGPTDQFFKKLDNMPLDELKELMKNNIEARLLPYANDEYAMKYSEYKTSQIHFDRQIDTLFTYSLSYHFYNKTITDELKETFKGYGEDLRTAFAKRIENNTWLSSQTKQAALDKLMKMKFYYGGPDQWFEEGLCIPKGESLVEDIIEMKKNYTRLIDTMLGMNVREQAFNFIILEVNYPLTEHNAYYSPATNSLHIHPSFMIAPEYTPNMDKGELYSLFYVIGHEITHGFDLFGSTYDGEGEKKNWWATEDRTKFEALNNKLIKHINTFEIAPGVPTDGERTIREDVADLGGLNISMDAMVAHMIKNGASAEEIKEEQKKFFEKFAERYRVVYNPHVIQVLTTDSHSAYHIRVNGMVQHMDIWYNLYNVTERDSLYLPKEERVTIW